MHRLVSPRVWVILALVLSSGWGELSAEAQLFRGRRQQKCCCRPQPCNPCCCEPRDDPRRCVITLLYSSGTWWYYYAHHHENGTECDFYNECFHLSFEELDAPKSCLAGECFNPTRNYTSSGPAPGLPAPIGASDDLSTLMPAGTDPPVDEVAGNITLPGRGEVHARIGVFKVKIPLKIGGDEKVITEYFGFGFESEDTGKDDIHAREVKPLMSGSTPQENIYEFKIGGLKCSVITTDAGP